MPNKNAGDPKDTVASRKDVGEPETDTERYLARLAKLQTQVGAQTVPLKNRAERIHNLQDFLRNFSRLP
jgi:hypothetical protein